MDEDEAQLLAELRAISAGSAASRFVGDEDENGGGANNNNEQSIDGPVSSQSRSTNSSKKTESRKNNQQPVPPWKRGRANQKPKQPEESPFKPTRPARAAGNEDQPIGFQNVKSSYQGERGGDANDDDLLAELRAISNQSGAVDRFATDDEEAEPNNINSQQPQQQQPPPSARPNNTTTSDRPPIKARPKFGTNSKSDKRGMDVLVSSQSEDQETMSVLSEPSAFAPSFQKPTLPQTFKGERGGAAEDEDLLAELRAISAKSAGVDRFAGSDDNEQSAPENHVEAVPKTAEKPLPPWKRQGNPKTATSAVASSSPATKPEASLPPWKRKANQTQNKPPESPHRETVVAAPPKQPETGGFQKSSLANTFKGDRGGSAEDEELLAQLRAISSNSGAADRFASDDNDEQDQPAMQESLPAPAAPAPKATQNPRNNNSNAALPPWKRKGQAAKPNQSAPPNDDETFDVVAVPTCPPPVEPQFGGFRKSSQPSTFQGERGGDAEDAELLAELMAISSKAGGADRFSQDEDADDMTTDPVVRARAEKSVQMQNDSKETAELPPWKLKGNQAAPKAENDVVVASKTTKSNGAVPPWKQKASQRPPQDEPFQNTQTTPEEQEEVGGFQKPNLPNTFTGERGGAAEDEVLLAELRAISANASSAKRFAESEEAEHGVAAAPIQSKPEPAKPMKPDSSNQLPPWKRKSAQPKPPPAADPLLEEPLPQMGGFQKSNMPSTFKGDRGGAAEDAELLAELMAISSGAGAANRFVDETEDGNESAPMAAQAEPMKQKKPAKNNPLPPWKKKPAQQKAAPPAADPIVEEPLPQRGGFQKSSMPNTFKGERGGAAEDDDLLAELRAISAGAGGASRFADSEETEDGNGSAPVATQPGPQKKPGSTNQLPPWKKSAQPKPPPAATDPGMEEPLPQRGGFQKSSMPSTFKGDRGGAAEDAELLAELMAISAGAGSANRFVDETEDGGSAPMATQPEPVKKKKPASNNPLPPWKMKGAQPKPPPAAADPVVVEEPLPQRGGFHKSSMPSTFKGDRGGAAEDAELLAELMAISSGAGAANRFSEETEDENEGAPMATQQAPVKQKKPVSNNPLPPWKKKGTQQKAALPAADPVVEEPLPERGGFQKSNIPSTFKGDRGGAAEDAALLAELMAISSGAGGADRFADTEADPVDSHQTLTAQPPRRPKPPAPTRPSRAAPAAPSSGPTMIETTLSASAGTTESSLTLDDLPGALKDKSWKTRKESYDLLKNVLGERVHGMEPTGHFDASSIVDGMDSLVPGMLSDSNASALDSALEFSLLYAEYCRGATMSGQAEEMLAALVKGGALSSSRPSTVKLTAAVVLKVIEVGDDGTASAHAVIDVLLRQGLTSKKPKIVLTASVLILQAATSFGAANLPLALVNTSAPKMLTHSNAKVRDNGLKIVAEIGRALGSTAPIQVVLDGMKKAQVGQLNAMIEGQPQPTPPSMSFRNQQGEAASPEDALAALEAGKKEMEAKRFASRAAINLVAAIASTDYATMITQPKWSQKVAGLDKVLECGGEKPYKLTEPSSSCNYGPLIIEMKKLLSNTHFAVVGKSMVVLSMLAEGVGEKLFPHLRPLLGNLLALGKDKKLTNFIGPCLDSFFGRILSFDHLLEEDAIPEGVNEKKQKNALARTSALDFLGRCVTRGESAGPRGALKVKAAKRVADLSVSKLDDSDAGVRKAAMAVLQNLQSVPDEDVSDAVSAVIGGLQSTNARAYKTLSKSMKKPSKAAKANDTPAKEKEKEPPKPSSARLPVQDEPKRGVSHAPAKKSVAQTSRAPPSHVAPVESSNQNTVPLDDAIEYLSQAQIPYFNEDEEDGGLLAGLQSTKWSSRQNSIKGLAAFLENDAPSSDLLMLSASLIVAVKENTRGFKETNINVTRAIMEFFITIIDLHYNGGHPLMDWAMRDIVNLAVDKIADRKVSALAKGLLLNVGLVSRPVDVVSAIAAKVEKVKSPVPHEECQHWFNSFCNEFGAASLGNGVKEVVPWLLKELKSSNIKVKKATNASIGTLHAQLGPIFKALVLSQCPDSERGNLEKTLESHPHDPSYTSAEWPRVSIATGRKCNADGSGGQHDDEDDNEGFGLEIPRMDLFSQLSGDSLKNMASKEGKTAWKIRKQAIDEVDAALQKCSSLVDCSPQSMKQLAELTRVLRDRLSDSQGNLKPLSARVIGTLLSFTDKTAQPKLGKIVHAALLNGAMNDIKKPVRDSSLEALRLSTTVSSIEGGGLNNDTLEPFMMAFASEVNDTAVKSVGLPLLLDFVLTFADQLPDLEKIALQRGQVLSEKVAQALVRCLTSTKSDTRSKAETILTVCVKNGSLPLARIRACTDRMKPATQRAVAPMLAKLARAIPSESQGEKENQPSAETSREPVQPRNSKPSARGAKKPERQVPSTPRTNEETAKHGSHGRNQKHHSPQSEATAHPLITDSGSNGLEKSRAALRSMVWPEYPEEPLGSEIFSQLKKAYAPVLPNTTLAAFFPPGGIRKQDDGTKGCECVTKAILMERAGDGVAIEEQLEMIFRWMAIVMCSKEHTVGLQALLSAMNDLFVYLQEIKYELSDSEAMLLLPFVFEKASLAKGRFQQVFGDLLVQMKSEEVLPMKRLGSVVAVAVLSKATQGKARVSACHDCCMCVEHLGLSGIGKKGVLVAAKALSDETLSENRSACLDLMELVLSRMNGDIQRLAKICGSSLSEKARRLIEERWQRRKTSGAVVPTRQTEDMGNSARRSSRIPTPQKNTPADKGPLGRSSPAIPSHKSNFAGPSPQELQDELPALVLRHKTTPNPSPAKDVVNANPHTSIGNNTNYLSTFNASTDSMGFNFSMSSGLVESESKPSRPFTPTLPTISSQHTGIPTPTTTSHLQVPRYHGDRESVGAAASLRARLLKIREKSKNPPELTFATTPTANGTPVAAAGTPEPKKTPIAEDAPAESPVGLPQPKAIFSPPQSLPSPDQSTEFELGMRCIAGLLDAPTPLSESSKELDEGIECMKKFHAALSKQQNVVVGMSSEDLSMMRQSISDNVDEMIERLARLMRFSLDCEAPTKSAGISVSLLSVCLATLMALFRDKEMAARASQDRLTLLIRETGTALLDPRLVVSNQASSLDEATSTQVVRAINKLAVQAATGGSREASLGALLSLQRQLSFEASALNARLSRVITKLFARVIKAEEGTKPAWQSVDLDVIVHVLNEHFEACDKHEEAAAVMDRDSIIACGKMAKTLVESLAKSPGCDTLRETMSQAGLDPYSSPLGVALGEFATTTTMEVAEPPVPRPQTPSRGIAILVAALANAQSERDRAEALQDLRQYISEHGEQDLNSHLEQVSPAFRKFIHEQLYGSSHGVENDRDDESVASAAMAERLRNLRSRLNAKEAQMADKTLSPKVQTSRPVNLPLSPSSAYGADVNGGSVAASTMDTASLASRQTQSLRERLAAANASRKSNLVAPETSSTSGSRAAALRARLQAVKQQSQK
ncbi:Cytoskeleton-associated protein 5 [Seminavis robusta]|uniref:Cytoskeleton-associated protein 5 n=1 Tax=Seminavis robusta TaxID=568900 RepID=A0A9N8ED97_9STRA|nr:Cytoskeleton-associated protein 5 [Seminavis robusta]|eukprot:Sro781_g201530.1 Cytoskeleton-associated protein 5 (3473) ;mRNA; r:5676-16587